MLDMALAIKNGLAVDGQSSDRNLNITLYKKGGADCEPTSRRVWSPTHREHLYVWGYNVIIFNVLELSSYNPVASTNLEHSRL